MKMQNPNSINQNAMLNNKANMAMASLLQKIGKGKRKFDVNLDKNSKKFFLKIVVEMKKQIANQALNPQMGGLVSFFDYLEIECKNTNPSIKMSFEELDFMKMQLSESVKGMENMQFKWYNFLKKITMKLFTKQYKALLEEFKK